MFKKGNWWTWWRNRAIRCAKLYHFPRDHVPNFSFFSLQNKNFEKFSKILFSWRIYFQSEESESVKNLFEGVKNDSIDQIRAALSDCDVNARRNGRTALHNAVMRSTPKVISFLIEQGANVNALWNVILFYDSYMMSHLSLSRCWQSANILPVVTMSHEKVISR